MGWLDVLWPWRQQVSEVQSPPPKEEPDQIDPIGFGNELAPLDKADRKNPAAVVAAALRTSQARSRSARYRDFEAMDTSDIAAMLDAVVDAALTFEDVSTGRGFKVESEDPNVQELLTRASTVADIPQLAEEVLRDMLKYGDAFVEPLFDGAELVGAQTYAPAEVFVARNDKGALSTGKDDDGRPTAYQQKKNGAVVCGWEPWELIHFKYAPSRKLLYSRVGLLDGLRADWRKLQLVEQGLVTARVTRAYPRRVHYVDVTGKDRQAQEDTLKAYIARMTKRQYGRKPVNDDGVPVVDVSDDLYITTGYDTGPDGRPYPKLNKTDIEDPATAGLNQLADVQYMRAKLWAQIPADVVGIPKGTNADLDGQDVAFTRLLRRCQSQLESGLRAIFDQVLLASGRLPSQVSYTIVLPTIDLRSSWKHADARFRASMTLRNYLETNTISRRFMLKQAYNLTDQEIDAMWAETAEERTNPIFQVVDPAAPASSTGTTANGVDKTTDLGQRNRGAMSGG